jgi:hypothetical protein
MAKIIHEVWEEIGERGETLPGLCHEGPAGEGFRKLLAANARASVPNPKFACFAASSGANFGFDQDTSKLIIPVSFMVQKFARWTRGNDGANF